MIAAIFKVAVCVALAGTFVLWIDHRSETVLPTPSGAYPVGRSIQDWRDSQQELLAWIWYPAARPSSLYDDYLPPKIRTGLERNEPAIIHFLMRDLSRVHAHSIREAEVSRMRPSFPVVIFRGGGSAGVNRYSLLAEDLASHGYIVVGLDAPSLTGTVAFPDGRVVRQPRENNVEFCQGGGESDSACIDRLLHAWTVEIASAVDYLTRLNASDPSGRFSGHLDMAHLGLFGHSFGGAQVAEFCHDDSRCKAAIDLDGLVFANFAREGARQPFMFVFSRQINSKGYESSRIRARFDQVYNRLPFETRARFLIRGSNHFFFSEEQALLTSPILMRTLRGLGIVGIDGARQIAATEYLVRSFFDEHLKNLYDFPLSASRSAFSEIEPLTGSH